MTFINPLLKTEPDYVEIEPFEFEEEQSMVARSIHLIENEDCGVLYEILIMFIQKFKQGEIKRMKYTIPASIFALCRLVRQVNVQKASSEKLNFQGLFNLMKELLDLIAPSFPEMSLKLILQFILIINEVD